MDTLGMIRGRELLPWFDLVILEFDTYILIIAIEITKEIRGAFKVFSVSVLKQQNKIEKNLSVTELRNIILWLYAPYEMVTCVRTYVRTLRYRPWVWIWNSSFSAFTQEHYLQDATRERKQCIGRWPDSQWSRNPHKIQVKWSLNFRKIHLQWSNTMLARRKLYEKPRKRNRIKKP